MNTDGRVGISWLAGQRLTVAAFESPSGGRSHPAMTVTAGHNGNSVLWNTCHGIDDADDDDVYFYGFSVTGVMP